MPTEQVSTGLDLSLVIAVAALVLSALSPLVSSLISGLFRIKEQKLELAAEQKEQERDFYYRHRAEVIEKYISAAGQVIESGTYEGQADFGAVMGEIYFYVDESLWPLLDGISQYIHTDNSFSAKDDFIKLCKELSSTEIRTQNKEQPQHTDTHQPKEI